jgi:hypothetical protein
VGGTVPVGPVTDPEIVIAADGDVVVALGVAVMVVGRRALAAMVTATGAETVA